MKCGFRRIPGSTSDLRDLDDTVEQEGNEVNKRGLSEVGLEFRDSRTVLVGRDRLTRHHRDGGQRRQGSEVQYSFHEFSLATERKNRPD